MQIFKGIDAARSFISKQKKLDKRIGLVPTMGALHKGHLSLVEQSLSENDLTMASIFVNPLQFNNPGDLAKYPRTINQDINLLEASGCQSVFIPAPEEMYKKPVTLSMNFGNLDKVLEGEFRPGHFSGVGVVVSKLFHIINPDVAYFGQKDFQQYLIIKRIGEDLDFFIDIRCGEIVREHDGLAMSSRNQRLSKSEREIAPLLYKTLVETKKSLSLKSLQQLKAEAEERTKAVGIRLEYLELANSENLQILPHYSSSVTSILLIAAYIGEVRLIDNIFV